ncbi:Uncharacterized protein Fot_34560 [Forsythia ovata]|uniref:Uncharacterized protein n=1 Tax=Forsythia ovata TaxID=205694 RepID=A0ABD1SJ11_9LAMI
MALSGRPRNPKLLPPSHPRTCHWSELMTRRVFPCRRERDNKSWSMSRRSPKINQLKLPRQCLACFRITWPRLPLLRTLSGPKAGQSSLSNHSRAEADYCKGLGSPVYDVDRGVGGWRDLELTKKNANTVICNAEKIIKDRDHFQKRATWLQGSFNESKKETLLAEEKDKLKK